MGQFNRAIVYTRNQEGGYVNDLNDDGGETYCGISRVANPGWEGWPTIDMYKAKGSIKKGTIIQDSILNEMVNTYYYKVYWNGILGDQINSQRVAGFLFDWEVTSGGTAKKAIQRLAGVMPDGDIGPATITAINKCGDALFDRLKATRIQFYMNLVKKEPKDARYLSDWIRRCNDYTC